MATRNYKPAVGQNNENDLHECTINDDLIYLVYLGVNIFTCHINFGQMVLSWLIDLDLLHMI